MAIKKKLNATSIQTNGSINELPEKREKIRAQVEFRHDLLESQKRVNYQNGFDRLQGAKKLTALDTNAKTRMKELQKKARKTLNATPSHRIYSTKF